MALALVLSLPGAGCAGASLRSGTSRVALVIGNGSYDGQADLRNPPEDARALSAALRRLGFQVEEMIDADKAQMDSAFGAFSERAWNAEVSFFFYAGHGLQINGINYMVPVDAQFSRHLQPDFDPSTELVALNPFVASLRGGAPVNLIFLDACRSSPLVTTLSTRVTRGLNLTRSGQQRGWRVSQGLAEMEGIVGALIAYATQPGNVAADGHGEHSPFTSAILEHIERPGLEVRGLMTSVRKDVLASTNGNQVPWDSSSLTREFYFQKPEPIALPPP